MANDVEREAYANQKGGLHLGDLSRIAMDYLNVSVESVAGFGLTCACIAFMLPFVVYWQHKRYKRIEDLLTEKGS